ncbi:ABC transporter ATP-binding protein [Anaerorhabdus sp.]|uniref:ABC transporter ATP-binding protein n=2 Tax=Anaerorhabdus sp. TaxID=1872524 RepID=UPI002FC993F1
MKIELRNISKKYNGLEVLRNINLEILDSGITCIYGESGCGKTTLLNIMGLIETCNSGEIYYDGNLILKEKDKRMLLRNKISFIFQNFGLVDDITVIDNIRLAKKNEKLNSIEIENALQRFGLVNITRRKIYELSGGEQQRVALVKAYLKDTDIIFADEPTASLDDANMKIVMNMLKEFSNEGKTVVIVTHNKEVRDYCEYKIDLSALNKVIESDK